MNRNHSGFFTALLVLAWQAQGTDINHSPFSHPHKVSSPVAARALAAVPQVYTTSHFAIVYTTSGVNAIAQGGLGLDAQGVPKVVDSLGVLAEQVWRLAIDTLGYPAPPALDTALALGVKLPAGKFPIEILDLVNLDNSFSGEGTMGYAVKPNIDPAGKNRMELLLENDFVDGGTAKPIRVIVDPINNNGDTVLIDYSKDPLKGWSVALAHEFYHNLQYEYDYGFTYAFHEMTAVWFATRAFPGIHHEWQYYPRFMGHLDQSPFLTSGTVPYENFLFVTEMVQVYGEGILKELWPLHATDFTGDEAVWFNHVIKKTNRDEVAFTSNYLKGILSLYANVPHSMNENGRVKVNPRPITAWQVIADSSLNSSISGGNIFGARLIHMNNGQFTNGWNLMFEDAIDSSSSVGGWAGFPSGEIVVVHPGAGTVSFARKNSDTSLVTGIMTGLIGQNEWSVDCLGTKNPPSSAIQPRLHPTGAFVIKHRVDLNGRPVSSATRGVILEGDYATGWRRKVLVGE
jgi:hypothetical protein